jgi:hypothetical protein
MGKTGHIGGFHPSHRVASGTAGETFQSESVIPAE